jgi:hypothetical protein
MILHTPNDSLSDRNKQQISQNHDHAMNGRMKDQSRSDRISPPTPPKDFPTQHPSPRVQHPETGGGPISLEPCMLELNSIKENRGNHWPELLQHSGPASRTIIYLAQPARALMVGAETAQHSQPADMQGGILLAPHGWSPSATSCVPQSPGTRALLMPRMGHRRFEEARPNRHGLNQNREE